MKIDFNTPKYIFCDTPIKDGSFHDQRTWIYATQALSLIEFINTDNFKDFKFKDFTYFNHTNIKGEIESWIGIFTQNNCEVTDTNQKEVMEEAWSIFKDHLTQLDSYE